MSSQETAEKPYPTNQPTKEFTLQAVQIIQEWQTGQRQFSDGITQMRLLIAQAIEEMSRANEAFGKSMLGVMYHHHGDFERSIQNYEAARLIFAEIDNRRHVAGCNINLGEVYRYTGNYSRALQMYRSAVEAAEALKDPIMRAIATTNQGLTLLALEQHDAALSTLQNALTLTLELPESQMATANQSSILCEIYQSLSKLYLAQGKPLDAWNNARSALQVADKSGDARHRGFAYRALGDALTALKFLPDETPLTFSRNPDDYYQSSYKAFGEINAEAEQARTVFAQAESLAKRGRRASASRKLRHAMDTFTTLGMVDDAIKAGHAQIRAMLQRK